MKLRHLLPLAAAATALCLVPASALAQTDTTRPPRTERRDQMVERVKARCLAEIDRRQRALEVERTRLAEADALADAHRAALQRINESASNGLASLADEIQGEDNGEELRAECRRIVEDFRVFTLVRPRARLVIASDRELKAVERLTGVGADIQAAIDDAKADGRDTADAESKLAEMKDATATAQSNAGGVYDAVIGLTPADYNANHDVLDPSRDAVKAAREAIRTAVSAGRAAMQSLRATES